MISILANPFATLNVSLRAKDFSKISNRIKCEMWIGMKWFARYTERNGREAEYHHQYTGNVSPLQWKCDLLPTRRRTESTVLVHGVLAENLVAPHEGEIKRSTKTFSLHSHTCKQECGPKTILSPSEHLQPPCESCERSHRLYTARILCLTTIRLIKAFKYNDVLFRLRNFKWNQLIIAQSFH